MRKIDVIANEKFNGDIKQTIKYLLYNSSKSEFHQYALEMNEVEASYTLDLIEARTIENVGGLDNYKALYRREEQIHSMNMTFEEVRDAKVNPFKQKLHKSLLSMLIMEGGVLALLVAGIPVATVGTIAALTSGLLSMVVASNLINYCKFKKVKKSVDQEVLTGGFNLDSKGRGR